MMFVPYLVTAAVCLSICVPAVCDDAVTALCQVSDDDLTTLTEQEYVERGRNKSEPFPTARLYQDWLYQDHGTDWASCFTDPASADREIRLVDRVLSELEAGANKPTRLREALAELVSDGVAGVDPRWRALYLSACQLRRAERLAVLRSHTQQIVFTKHYFLSGVVHYAWTDHITDEQYSERNVDYRMGSSLHLLSVGEQGKVSIETLLAAPSGVIRDPSVSYDGTRIVFAMRHNDTDDDYHLYVLDMATRSVRQLTSGPGVSDTEPCFLPNGDIVFISSRCVQLTDCWRQAVSNLYTCDGEGRFLRRLGYDQVHTNFPQTLDDGRVIYTRWEYNDRGQIFPQPLFVMNADGTGQAEYYGGNSWFPTSILHARGIPGTQKVIGIASGHHTTQRGKLVLVDRSRGTQEATGIEYLAPRRAAEPVRVDQFGWEGEQFQYPYALDEHNYLVTYCPEGSPHPQNGPFPVPYAVYFMTEDGRRELLAYDPAIHCNQAVPLSARPLPPQRPSQVDYAQTMGSYYVQDVYLGTGMAGVPRGTVKALRVVALEYRAADTYYNSNIGEAGCSHSRTPPSINNGSWDVKHVLGTVPVEPDGSAWFQVPARTPVYFQLLDERGYAVQTMRSWSTLQPGEIQTCVGCHENKHQTPPASPAPSAGAVARRLTPFDRFAAQHGLRNPVTDTTLTTHEAVQALLTVNSPRGFGEPEGFSYTREIQPILDTHCVRCHGKEPGPDGRPAPMNLTGEVLRYTFTQCPNNGDATQDPRRAFTASYLNLTRFGHGDGPVNWISAQSRPTPLPAYSAGAATSKLMDYLEPSHYDIHMSQSEKERIACWIDLCVPFCGSYTEANEWEPQVRATYLYFEAKRARLAEIEIDNLRRLWAFRTGGELSAASDSPVFNQGGPAYRRHFEQSWLEQHGYECRISVAYSPPTPQITPARQEESCSYVDRSTERSPMRWEGETPADCPFEKSRDIKGVVFTGRYANYTACDYWYPAWAADGHLYSACGDGEFCGHRILNLGLARISGDDPLDLRFTYLGHFNVPDFRTSSAYGCTSLIKNGVWYLGLEEGWNSASAGTPEGLARFWGFLCGRGAQRSVGDLGYPFPPHDAWEDRTNHPLRRAAQSKAASQPGTSDAKHMGGFFGERPGINRFRNLHFVDFGRELEHSPDGKAYAVTHGSIGVKPAEWGNGDNVYLLRVEANCEQICDPRAWQFFAGKNERGEAVWSDRIDDLKPLLSWEDRLGLAHVVYNAPLKKYLMWVSPLLESDTYIMNEGPRDTFSAEGSLLLESAELSGPWRLVEYFHRLGPNAYCICFPSKFISPDGRSAWLLCSANYTNAQDPGKPTGMRYSAHFREVEFVMP